MAKHFSPTSNPFAMVAAISRGMKDNLTLDEAKEVAVGLVARQQVERNKLLEKRAAFDKIVADKRALEEEKIEAAKQILLRPVGEQCIAIQKDSQVFFSLPANDIKIEHVDAILSKFSRHISDLSESLVPESRGPVSRLWTGAFVAKVLKKTPKELHTEKMLVQFITGQAEPNRFYVPTKYNRPPTSDLLNILKKHPLMSEDLGKTLVKLNPWVVFGIPREFRNPELSALARQEFFDIGMINEAKAPYTWLDKIAPSLDEYAESVGKTRQADSAPAVSDLDRMIQKVKAEFFDINFNKNINSNVQLENQRVVGRCSDSVQSNLMFELLFDDKKHEFSIIRNQGGHTQLFNCLTTRTDGERTMAVSFTKDNGKSVGIGIGYLKQSQLILNMRNGDQLIFPVDLSDRCFHGLGSKYQKRSDAPADQHPQEASEDFDEDDLKRLRSDHVFERPRG